MNFQQSHGHYSPNINGNDNKIGSNTSNVRISLSDKARYTLLGFLLGIATSYLGSYLYENCKLANIFGDSQTERTVTNQSTPEDSQP